ncbi:MAG: DNA mismatch repair endonuclease MutL [Nitrospiraceae bacterium]|nr:DNA mismatch repair endonuclease MutL [Nitrospiraceae bacterium]
MPHIKVLPEDLRNKIAAGEVIERPASVVKELVENSIDAGASRIRVDIMRAGKKLIRVSDNGRGMERDDALLSFERHATSKISSDKDLFNITTNGFRGEALSSIAAVSKVMIATSVESGSGTCVDIEAGQIKSVKECSAAGTTIEIKDLFFNTPARLKFLKTDSTENFHIIETVTTQALANHSIGFNLGIDGNETLSLPPASSIKERIVQIFGSSLADELKDAMPEGPGIRSHVFAATPECARSTRALQYVFVNKRPVKDQTASYAVYKAYEGLIPKEKHPVFFVFLSIPPDRVDFNVHPAKREVRFADKSAVFNHVKMAVRDAVAQTGLLSSPENIQYDKYDAVQPVSEFIQQNYSYESFQSAEPQVCEDAACYTNGIPFLYLGSTFVAVQHPDGLMLIDYHAAHERINYERFMNKELFNAASLLFPAQVQLRPSEYSSILANLSLLKEFGFDIEDFGSNSVIVRTCPDLLSVGDFGELLSDIANCLAEADHVKDKTDMDLEPVNAAKKSLAARLACHSSIRGRSEAPDAFRIANLLKDLRKTETPGCCPHGRPTTHVITLDEMKKIFKR